MNGPECPVQVSNLPNVGSLKNNIRRLSLNQGKDLFNHTDGLAVGRDVTVSSTMIKVTYNKGFSNSANGVSSRRNTIHFESNSQSCLSSPLQTSFSDNQEFSEPNISEMKEMSSNSLIVNIKKECISPHKCDSNFENSIVNGKKSVDMSSSANSNDRNNSVSLNVNIKDLDRSITLKKSPDKDQGKNSEKDKNVQHFGNEIVRIENNKIIQEMVKNSMFSTSEFLKETKNLKKCSRKMTDHQEFDQKKTTTTSFRVVEDNKNLKRKNVDVNEISPTKKSKKENEKNVTNIEKLLSDENTTINKPSTGDPKLPHGWQRTLIVDKDQTKVAIISPEGRLFTSRCKLRNYLKTINSPLAIEQFSFILHKGSTNNIKKTKAGKDGSQPKNKDLKKLKGKNELTQKNVGKSSKENKEKTVKVGAAEKDKNERKEENPNANAVGSIMFFDPNLPPDWKRLIEVRDNGQPTGRFEVLIQSPSGQKFSRKHDLIQYLKESKSPFKPKQFYFGLYHKGSSNKEKLKDQKTTSEGTESKSIALTKHKNIDNLKYIKVSKILKAKKKLEKIKNLQKNRLKNTNHKAAVKMTSNSKVCESHKNKDKNVKNNSKRKNTENVKDSIKKKKMKNGVSEKGAKEIPERGDRLCEKTLLIILPKADGNPSKSHLKGLDEATGSISLKADENLKTSTPKKNNANLHDAPFSNSKENPDSKNCTTEVKRKHSPQYINGSLPEGWQRRFKVRKTGDTAGRTEVYFVSPDGRRHRYRGGLENYIRRKGLDLDPKDFSFSVFKNGAEDIKDSSENTIPTQKKTKLCQKKVESAKLTPESLMINEVSGLMVSSGLINERKERHQKMTREKHEKMLKEYLSSAKASEDEDSTIPTSWIQKLSRCRSENASLDKDAAANIAAATEQFLKNMILCAFQSSETLGNSLQYNDVAKLVESTECLSPLRTLIPNKITFKDFVNLKKSQKRLSLSYT